MRSVIRQPSVNNNKKNIFCCNEISTLKPLDNSIFTRILGL